MANPVILIAMMIDKDKIFQPEIVNSLGLIQQSLLVSGWKFEIIYTVNKNEAIAIFLGNTVFTHILFLNSYTSIQFKDIKKMVQDNVDLVCVAIPQKEYQLDLLFANSMVKYIKKITEERTKIIEKYTKKINEIETKKDAEGECAEGVEGDKDGKEKDAEKGKEKEKDPESIKGEKDAESDKGEIDKQIEIKKNEEIEKLNRYLISNYVNMSSKLLKFQVNFLENSNLINDGLLQVKNACLDCSLIKKIAIVNMIKKYKDLKINDPNIMKKYSSFYYGLFNGGDESFCDRYNKIDGKIMIDTIIQTTTTFCNVKILSQFFASLKIKSEKDNYIQ
jgi:F0F1-type ATP synthase membrane subunit b/b'